MSARQRPVVVRVRRGLRWFDAAAVVTFAVLPAAWLICYLARDPAHADQLMRVGVYLALALALARPAVGAAIATRSEPRFAASRARLDAAAGAATGVAVEAVGLHWILFSNAVPLLRHDWTWPVSALEVRRLGALATEAWVPSGLGSPKAFPTLYVMDVPLSLAAALFDSHAVLMFALLAGALVAGLGLTLLLRRELGASLGATLVAVAAYVASPFAFDEFVAGHTPNLLAFDLLPLVPLLVAALARTAPGSRRAPLALGVALGLVVAVSAAQIQYVVFDALAALLALALRPVSAGRAALAAGAALLVVAGAHGQSFAHLLAPGHHDARSASVSPVEWFFTLSKPTPPILAQSGYIGGYADENRLLPPDLQIALLASATWCLAGFALARGGRAGLFFASLVLVGLLGATGVYGPFAELKLLLAHVRAMTALREAYNFQCLTTLGIAGCIALGLDAAGRSKLVVRGVRAAAWTTAFVGAYAWLSGSSANELHVHAESAAESAARAVIAADPGDGRVAMLPLIEPIRQDGFPYGGSEPNWAGFGGHSVLTEFEPDSAFATAALLLRAPDPSAGLRLLGRIGVKYLVLRNDLVSDLPQYWFPALFPPDWSTRDDYPRLQASPLLHERFVDPELGVYELATYRAPLSLATARTTCSDRFPVLALAEAAGASAACPAGAQPEGAIRRVPLAPDGSTFDPAKAWISATKLFSLGAAFAATPGAVGTTAATFATQRFDARPGDDVALPCIALHAPLISLDGGPFRPLRCGQSADGGFRWTVFRGAGHPGATLVLAGRGGAALVGPLALGARLDRAGSAARFEVAIPAASGPRLTYTRRSPERLEGTVTAERGTLALFSDAYDDRWRLHLSDGTVLRPQRANGFENGFALPAGTHAFALTFEPETVDRMLDALQAATWPLAALALLALRFARMRR